MTELRPLRASDLPEITEMVANVWGGADHLPSLVPKWLDDAKSNPYVILVEGEICAVGNLHVTDEGTTGWMEGLRVRESRRKRGLGKQMTDKMVEVAKAKGVERLRLVTAAQSKAPQKLAAGAGLEPICSMKVFWIGLMNVEWVYNSLSFRSVDTKTFLNLVLASPHLVPHAAINKHYDVYDAARGPGSAEVFEGVNFYKGERNRQIASLSLGFTRDTKWGVQWCATLYPTDEDTFLSEMSHHLALARTNQATSLMGIHPERFVTSHRDVPWLKKKKHEIDLILFERLL